MDKRELEIHVLERVEGESEMSCPQPFLDVDRLMYEFWGGQEFVRLLEERRLIEVSNNIN